MTDAVKPAPDGVVISRELFAFLCGDGPMQGHWFGEKPEHEQGNFWWRKALRAADNAMVEAETIKGIILAFIDADDATHWGDFEKALDRAVSAPPAATSDRVEALSKALSLLDTFAGDGIGHTFGNGQTIDADDTVLELVAAFGIEPEPGWWRIVAGEVAQRLGQEFDAGEGLAALLTKAIGDITVALTWAGKSAKIAEWTAPYVAAVNQFDTCPPQSRGQAFDGEGEARRVALIERLGTFGDLLSSDPLEGEKGDVAYDLIRQAAAQISSDRQRLAALSSAKRGEEG